MNWVEKSSFEKIRRLSKIFEQEHHYKVLLTPNNISTVRRNPAPYTLLVIPLPLPLDIVEGEHFVIANLQRLISSSACPSGDPVLEASSRVQGAGSASGSSTSPSKDSSSLIPFPVREPGVAVPNGSLCLSEWPDPPLEWYRSYENGQPGDGTGLGPRGRISFLGLVPNMRISRIWRRRNGMEG